MLGHRTQNPEVPDSIPGSRGSLLGHFLVGSGSLVHDFWDMLGCVWEYFGDAFGWIWDGFVENYDEARKSVFFTNMFGSIFPESGRFRITLLAYPRTKKHKI